MLKILVCIIAHSEGELLSSAFDSVTEASRRLTWSQNVRVIVVADAPDSKTKETARTLGCEVIEIDYQDSGPARNWALGTFANSYDLIGFLDGDDMWDFDFLVNAVRVASSASPQTIVSPRYRVQFWGKGIFKNLTFWQPTVRNWSRKFFLEASRATNLWGSTFLITSEAAKTLRFRSESDGFGYEDWWFSVDSLEAGVERRTAKGVHFYRQRLGSRRRKQAAIRLPDPSGDKPKPLRNPGAKFGKNRSYWGLIILLLQFRPWVSRKPPLKS